MQGTAMFPSCRLALHLPRERPLLADPTDPTFALELLLLPREVNGGIELLRMFNHPDLLANRKVGRIALQRRSPANAATAELRRASYFKRCDANPLLVVFAKTEPDGVFLVSGFPNECVLMKIVMRPAVDQRHLDGRAVQSAGREQAAEA